MLRQEERSGGDLLCPLPFCIFPEYANRPELTNNGAIDTSAIVEETCFDYSNRSNPTQDMGGTAPFLDELEPAPLTRYRIGPSRQPGQPAEAAPVPEATGESLQKKTARTGGGGLLRRGAPRKGTESGSRRPPGTEAAQSLRTAVIVHPASRAEPIRGTVGTPKLSGRDSLQ